MIDAIRVTDALPDVTRVTDALPAVYLADSIDFCIPAGRLPDLRVKRCWLMVAATSPAFELAFCFDARLARLLLSMPHGVWPVNLNNWEVCSMSEVLNWEDRYEDDRAISLMAVDQCRREVAWIDVE